MMDQDIRRVLAEVQDALKGLASSSLRAKRAKRKPCKGAHRKAVQQVKRACELWPASEAREVQALQGGPQNQDIQRISGEVQNELKRARELWPAMHSAHEGYSVILEELDELWEVVKLKATDPERNPRAREEAIQVAAMAMRFVLDVCDK